MAITINGLDINDGVSFLVTEVQYRSPAKRQVETGNISRTPGLKLLNAEWAGKEIDIKGHIFGTTASGLRGLVDTFQQYLTPKNIALAIEEDRAYTATLSKMDIPVQFFNNTYVPFDVTFLASDPFAYSSLVTLSGVTTSGNASTTITATISGSVFAEPIITLTPVGGASGDSGIKQLNVAYVSTGETVSVSGTFNYAAPISIDYGNFNVTVAGVASDYTGVFSRFEPGRRGITFTVASGVSNQFQWKLQYQPRYYQ